MPKLEVAGYIESTELVYGQGLRINIEEGYDEPLDFDAPNLHTLNGQLEVYGGVSRLASPENPSITRSCFIVWLTIL